MFENLIQKSVKAGAIDVIGVIAANIVDDTKDFNIPVALPEEGNASINRLIDVPEEFTPGEAIVFLIEIFNLGSRDTIFLKVINRDTSEVLLEKSTEMGTGDVWQQWVSLTLVQTTDFHGRVHAGHVE